MPGSGRCARCGGLLAIATAAIDVHPPREPCAAAACRVSTAGFGPFIELSERYRTKATNTFRTLGDRLPDADFSFGTVFRCVIPGWAQLRRGHARRGRTFAMVYSGLLLAALLFFGTTTGSILLGLAFATHVASAGDALSGRRVDVNDRVAVALASAVAIGLLLYYPVGLFAARYVAPIQLRQDLTPFDAGDVLWYNRRAVIEPGDYVVHIVPELNLIVPNRHTRYRLGNRWISRVLAIAGQQVRLKNCRLWVDGQLSHWQPAAGAWTDIDSD